MINGIKNGYSDDYYWLTDDYYNKYFNEKTRFGFLATPENDSDTTDDELLKSFTPENITTIDIKELLEKSLKGLNKGVI